MINNIDFILLSILSVVYFYAGKLIKNVINQTNITLIKLNNIMITIQYVYRTESGQINSYKTIAIENFNQLIFLN